MFSSLLPKPQHCSHETIKPELPQKVQKSNALLVPAARLVPSVPESSSTSQTLAELHLDPTGNTDYGKKIASALSGNPLVQASYEDTIPLKQKYPQLKHHFPRYTLETCPDDSLRICVDETREVIHRLLEEAEGKEEPAPDVEYLNYTPNTLAEDGERGRLLEIRKVAEDPMLPPKFKLRKNREKEPSPPPPILKATPTEKVTKEMKDKWHIPSAVSNWKNNQGYAISLEKRVKAASGGSLEAGPSINVEKFSQLNSALEEADETARKEIALRNQQRKENALKEQAEKERHLKQLLDKSRQQTSTNASKKRARDDYKESSKRTRMGN